MSFACIFVPNFSLEAILRSEPDLRAQALVVLEGKPPLQKVFAVNEKARQLGIEPAMTKLQAETCPEIILRPRSLQQESSGHAALLDCARSFSPRVEDAGDDTILLDVSGLQRLFGSLPEIAHDIAQRACEFGLLVNVGVGSNADVAMLAACGFSGVKIIPEGREAEQLGAIPLNVLLEKSKADHEQNVEMFETFQRWGVCNLRDLAALPGIALSERLGQAALYLQQLARGATHRTLIPFDPPLIFEEAVELEHPILLLEPLAFLLNRMLEQLCARLESRALATQELHLELELQNGWHEDGDAVVERKQFHRTLRLPFSLIDPNTFLKLLQLDLNANPPGAPISKIVLRAEPTQPRVLQNDLFLPPSPEPEKLELTLAKIMGIVGEGNVGSPQLLDTHRPQAFRMQHFSSDHNQKVAGTHDDHKESSVTALRIFRPAWHAMVKLHNGSPVSLTCSHFETTSVDVLWCAGPWHSCGDWWQQDGWARDEWDIAVPGEASIALYRLVHDRLSGRWFLEGKYD